MAFGQLDRGGTAQPMHEINVTPLVDVMLVLLVVFIITAPFLTHHIPLNLPKVSNETRVTQQPLTVSLTRDGQLFLASEALTREQLAERLRAAVAAELTPNVELRADGQVVYEDVVKVLDLIQDTGVTKVAFVTDPGPSQ